MDNAAAGAIAMTANRPSFLAWTAFLFVAAGLVVAAASPLLAAAARVVA
jgi:hypothetical protein